MSIPSDHVELSEYLAAHVRAEEQALAAYERLVEGRPDDVIRYLVGLVLDDEVRHHQIFLEMKNSLDSAIRWEEIEPRLPSLRPELQDHDEVDDLRAITERLLELERDDERELRRLRRQWQDDPGDRRLWALLVEVAELDTKKHIRILEFLREILRGATP